MDKILKIVGQILLAIGITLTIGGISSFLFENVELRFIDKIVNKNDRILWIIINIFIALIGFLVLYFSKRNKAT